MSRVAVLMSGGVDSSAAALLLTRDGHEAVGITARLWDNGSRCCDEEDIYRAQRVCHAVKMRHIVLDLKEDFSRHVVTPFREGYMRGETPNPCSVCNRDIKFGKLLDAAMSCGCDLVATGHYAGLGRYRGRVVIKEPESREKSQTYFLALMRPTSLERATFPMERVSKDEARAMLSDLGLPARTRESQDLCFITSGRYEEFLRREEDGRFAPGSGHLLDMEGNVVGTHKGHFAYTVGQKLGHRGKRSYVIEKRPETNEVVVGDREHTMATRIAAREANWFVEPGRHSDGEVIVKFRYNTPASPGRISSVQDGRFEVVLSEPCFAPAPGQILACYKDDYLLGGGVIAAAMR
jgi:tRNA-specific 2-thiouridylase